MPKYVQKTSSPRMTYEEAQKKLMSEPSLARTLIQGDQKLREVVKTGVKSISGWVKAGMPLPGAVKPDPGKTYLRGKQVEMYHKTRGKGY